MNRRGFLATITALAGLALAKIKAPAAPKYVAGMDAALPDADTDMTAHYVWIQTTPHRHKYGVVGVALADSKPTPSLPNPLWPSTPLPRG
jgi:hypothetical protein